MKRLRYGLEALGLHTLFLLFRALPPSGASAFGGWLGRTISPCLAASRKALRNMEEALPELSAAQRHEALRAMWDNLGRVIAEYPHLETLSRDYTDVEGEEILKRLFASGKPAIFIGAHLANWEINCAAMLTRYNRAVDLTYRAPNNPWSDRLLLRARTLGGRMRAYAKSRSGGKEAISALKQGRYLGMLIDQKYNEGLAVPFFGRAAMTNPAFVQLAQKFGAELIPVRGERLEGGRFRLTVCEPLPLHAPDGSLLPVEAVIESAHILLEKWIRDRPGQWLWLHRRWPGKNGKEQA